MGLSADEMQPVITALTGYWQSAVRFTPDNNVIIAEISASTHIRNHGVFRRLCNKVASETLNRNVQVFE